MAHTCFCGEDLNDSGECWQGMFTGGHQGNCVICGKNADLDGMRCCSEECDREAEEREAAMLEMMREDGYFCED